MSGKKPKNTDPLFELFEHYLLNKSYDDSAKFTKEVAAIYLAYIDSTPAHVPFVNRATVLQDLESETHEMLIKKMYGVAQASDYANFGRVMHFEAGEELKPYEFNRDTVPAPTAPIPTPSPVKK